MRLLLLISLICLTTACFSQEKSALIKSKVTAFLRKTLNNPASYQSVSWGKLETVYTTFDRQVFDKVCEESMVPMDDIRRNFENRIKEREWAIGKDSLAKDTLYNNYKDSLMRFENEVSRIKVTSEQFIAKQRKAFKSKLDHYYIEHSFRARNAFNALMLTDYYFILDKNLNVIDSGKNE